MSIQEIHIPSLPYRDVVPCHQGDTFTYQFQVSQGTTAVNTPKDFTGYVFTGKVKSKSGTILIALAEGTGITITDLTGTVTMELTPAQTLTFDCGACYDFDIQSLFESKVQTWVFGKINVSKQI
jgi:hypothetical protein